MSGMTEELNWDNVNYDSNKIKSDTLSTEERKVFLENEDKKQDAQRNMAWFALFGMLLYPFAVVLAVYFKLDKAADILGDMAGTYFVSVAAIVAAFYGKEALMHRNSSHNVSSTSGSLLKK